MNSVRVEEWTANFSLISSDEKFKIHKVLIHKLAVITRNGYCETVKTLMSLNRMYIEFILVPAVADPGFPMGGVENP